MSSRQTSICCICCYGKAVQTEAIFTLTCHTDYMYFLIIIIIVPYHIAYVNDGMVYVKLYVGW